MKKVLFIVNSLGNGGGERVVANLANEMSKSNKVDILSIYNDTFYELNNNVTLYNMNQDNNKFKKFAQIFKLRKELNRLVEKLEKDGEYDLITIHLPFAHIVCKGTSFSKRSYFVIHTVYSKKIKRGIGKIVLKAIYNNTNIITVSEGVKDEFINLFNIRAKTIDVINNPIDIEYINQSSQKENTDVEKYILGLGRLTKIKRYDLLIQSYEKSNLKNTHKLVIVGDGEEKSNLIKLANDLGIGNNVIMKGWQTNPYKWIKNAEMLVVTSEYEAFPMNILEALACNTKVVSVDCNYGPREILKGDLEKYLIKDISDKNIALKIDEAFEYYPDSIDNYAKQYSIQRISQKYLEASNGNRK